MRYKRGLNTLIPNEAYDVSWTRLDGRDFHGRTPQEKEDAANPLLANGEQEFPWLSRCAAIALTINVNTSTPVLLGDNYRNLLILQNSSTVVAGSGDVAPTLYINFDQVANPPPGSFQYALALDPGVGIVLDTRVPTNSIYVAWGTSTGTPTVVGQVTYGRSPNSPPLSPQALITLSRQGPQRSATHIINTSGQRGF